MADKPAFNPFQGPRDQAAPPTAKGTGAMNDALRKASGRATSVPSAKPTEQK